MYEGLACISVAPRLTCYMVFFFRFLMAAIPVVIMLLNALLHSSFSYLASSWKWHSTETFKIVTKNFPSTTSLDTYNNLGHATSLEK